MREVDQYFLHKEEPHKSCLLALRGLILEQDDNVSETRKYGMPCYCYKNKVFCYLWTDKKTDRPYILFVEGKHLQHAELDTGKRARMKVLHIDPTTDLPLSTLTLLLNKALDLYKNGTVPCD